MKKNMPTEDNADPKRTNFSHVFHGKGHRKMTAEIGVMHLLAKEPQRLPATTRSWGRGRGQILLTASERTNPADSLI